MRCPNFYSPALIRFGAKIRPFQLSQLAVSSTGCARWLPPRGRFGFNEPHTAKTKRQALPVLLFWRRRRDFLRTPSLAVWFHHTLASSVSQTCGGKNVSPTRFSSPFKSLPIKTKKPCSARLLCFGGEGGI